MKRKFIVIALIAIFAGGAVVAQTMSAKGLNFAAPTVGTDPNAGNIVSDPQVGEIVFDNSANKTFVGFDGSSWVPMSGASVPPGTVTAFAGKNPPNGYVFCDGAPYSAALYPALANALWDATTSTFIYGGSGTVSSGTFNVPDLQGVFIRGAGSQTIAGVSYTGTLGSTQGDLLQGHAHSAGGTISVTNPGGGTQSNIASGSQWYITATNTGGVTTDGVNGSPRSGAETRPANVSMNYIIKL